jgi:methylthioxylose transferase
VKTTPSGDDVSVTENLITGYHRHRRAVFVAASTAVGVVLVGWWGARLNAAGHQLHASAAPFHGHWRLLDTPGWFLPVPVAVALIVGWPPLSDRLRWGWALAGSAVVSFTWAVVLTVNAGWDRLWTPLTSRYEYLPLAREIGGTAELGEFVRTFVERLPGYPAHVRGHPPLPVIGFWSLERIGFGDAAIGTLVVLLAAVAAPMSLVAFDRIAGRRLARRAVPFAGLAPAVLWVTSADGVFMGLAAASTAALAVAVTSTRRTVVVAGAVAAGLGASSLAFSTYGAPALLGPFAAIALWSLWKRRIQPIAIVAVAGLIPVLGFVAAGFWWFDGFEATRVEYWRGAASQRPYRYFVIANLAVLAAAVGPAAVGGLAHLRRNAAWLLVIGALVGAVVATLSGYSKGEVERIWLPLTPFLTLAAAALPGGTVAVRAWLGAQLAVAFALQMALGSPW